MKKPDADRIDRLEAEVTELRKQVNKLLSERQDALEAGARRLRRQIGLSR